MGATSFTRRVFWALVAVLALGLTQSRGAGAASFDPFHPKAASAAAPVQAGSSTIVVPAAAQPAATPVGPGNIVINISNGGTVSETAPNATAVFTVSLSKASTSAVSVSYFTTDGTARSGWDYVATNGTLTFQPGQTSKTISVKVLADSPNGPNDTRENFYVNLAGATGAKIGNGTGQATLLLGKPANNPKFSVSGATTFEGPGTKVQYVKVRLSFGVNADTACWFQTIDGSAKAGRDYVAVAHRIQFAPNQTVMSIPITILGDTTNPGSRYFLVGIAAPVAAGISNDTATVTLLKNQ